MSIDTKWFRHQLAERGLSQRQLARKLGLDQSAISLTFSGKRQMKFQEAADIARLLGFPVSDVLRAAGMPIENGQQTVPITGYLDGHGEIHCHESRHLERTPTPVPMPDGSACIQCRTAHSPLGYMDGWLLFRDPPNTSPDLERFSVIRVKNGIKTVGSLHRGYKRGRFNIAGPAMAVTDADVEWAAPIVSIRT